MGYLILFGFVAGVVLMGTAAVRGVKHREGAQGPLASRGGGKASRRKRRR
jgi:hypothetical protein